MSPWLSILAPVYNVAPYLRDCVDSVLSQADAGVELLLYDDCSTDESLAMLRALELEHLGRLRVIAGERNLGLSGARNALLEASRGEWIWFLDSDDVLRPGALPSLVAALAHHPEAELVFCDFQDFRDPAEVRLKHRLRRNPARHTQALHPGTLVREPSRLIEGLFRQGHLHSWSKIARRRLWGADLRFPLGRTFEDIATSPELVLRARAALYCREVWVGYRKRGGSILGSMNAKKADDMQDAMNGLGERLRGAGLDRSALLAAAGFMARMFMNGCQVAARTGDEARLARYLDQIEANLPLPFEALLRTWAAQGWFWRAARLRAWLARARRARRCQVQAA